MTDSNNSAVQFLFGLLNVSNFNDLSQYVKTRYTKELNPLLQSKLMRSDDPCISKTVMDIAMGEYFLKTLNKFAKLTLEIDSKTTNINNISKNICNIVKNIESAYAKQIENIKNVNIVSQDLYDAGQNILDGQGEFKSILSKIEIRLMELRERDRVQDARQAHLDLKQQELDRRQEEMDRRQAELDNRQAELDNRAPKFGFLRWFRA